MLNRLVEGSFVNGFKVFTFLWNPPFPKCPSRVQKHRLEFALTVPFKWSQKYCNYEAKSHVRERNSEFYERQIA